MPDRIFSLHHHLRPCEGQPIRSIVVETPHASIVAWHVAPGQCIASHVHPDGQDTWTIIAGTGSYRVDQAGTERTIAAGDIVVAPAGAVHGVRNHGELPLIFVSVVSPTQAGFVPVRP